MSYLDNESAHKQTHNKMFLEAVQRAINLHVLVSTPSSIDSTNYNLFVLDGVEMRTCKMLIEAGIPATNIHSPNYDLQAFQNLNELGVNTACVIAKKYIKARPDIKYLAVYYDGMATIEGSVSYCPLADLNLLISAETKVLQGTFAVRSKCMYNFESARDKHEMLLSAMLQTKQMYATKIHNVNYQKDEQSKSMNFVSMDIVPGQPATPISQTTVNIFLNIISGNKNVQIRPLTNKMPKLVVTKPIPAKAVPAIKKSSSSSKKPKAVSILFPKNTIPRGVSKQERHSEEYKTVHPANIQTGKRLRIPTSRPIFWRI